MVVFMIVRNIFMHLMDKAKATIGTYNNFSLLSRFGPVGFAIMNEARSSNHPKSLMFLPASYLAFISSP